MTPEEKLEKYADRVGLQTQDVDYIKSLLCEAKAEAYEKAARIVEDDLNPCEQCCGYSDELIDFRAKQLAARIRALKDSLVAEPVSLP